MSLHIAAVSPEDPSHGVPDRGLPFCLAVNIEGKRFVDEARGYVVHGKATLKQPGQMCALVFDEQIASEARVKTSMESYRRLGLPILDAPTLAALAEKMKVFPRIASRRSRRFAFAAWSSSNPPCVHSTMRSKTSALQQLFPRKVRLLTNWSIRNTMRSTRSFLGSR